MEIICQVKQEIILHPWLATNTKLACLLAYFFHEAKLSAELFANKKYKKFSFLLANIY